MDKTYHCEACGEGVQGYSVDLGSMTEVRCLSCGLPLEKKARRSDRGFRRVLVADDSAFFTEGLETFLRSRGLTQEVMKAPDGARAVELATIALRERRPVDLAILDLVMPGLSGLHAALALRAVERAFGSPPAAVLFLSSRRIDEGFRAVLSELKPAFFMNKGAGQEGLLGERLATILATISASLLGAA